MSEAVVLPLRFQIGARTLAAVPRRLVRVALSLDQALAGEAPVLAPLAQGTDGYLVTSLLAGQLDAVATAGLIAHVRQHYTRYYVDLSTGVDAWEAALSSATRSGLKRKAKKLAVASGGTLDVRRYATPDEIAVFHPLARAVSMTTYQERLLDSGLPADMTSLLRLAAADQVRAWLLFLNGRAIAYLCCTGEGDALRYDYVGHDPAAGELSPGAVLQAEALRNLMAERRFSFFDFTEGEGQHKRSLATGGLACADLLLLRPTLANRLALTALARFDGLAAGAKRWAGHPAVAAMARKVRR